MQCIRTKHRHSSASSSSLSVESINNFNNYFNRNSRRKSFLRRSFDLVRMNIVRRSENFARIGSKSEKNTEENVLRDGDRNNNRNSRITVFSTSADEYTYDGDVLTFSTNCDILTPKLSQKQRLKER